MSSEDSKKKKSFKNVDIQQQQHQAKDSSISDDSNRSITQIKNELQKVIESMARSPQNTISEVETSFAGTLTAMSDGGGTNSVTYDQHQDFTFVKKAHTNEIKYVKDESCMVNFDETGTYEKKSIQISNTSIDQQSVAPCQVCNCTEQDNCKKKPGLIKWLNCLSDSKQNAARQIPCELYRVNIIETKKDTLPRKLVFDLVEGIPGPPTTTVATNTKGGLYGRTSDEMKNMKNFKNQNHIAYEKRTRRQESNSILDQRTTFYDSNGNKRVDFYYFDHGNAQYFNTTDLAPIMYCDILVDKTNDMTVKFWAELFASIHVVISFITSFILQFFRFILYSLLRPLTVGILQLGSDYFFKPLLTTLFNAIIQPILIFFYNIVTSLRDICDPIAEGIGFFLREIAVVFRAIRLCIYHKITYNNSCEECNKNCEEDKGCGCKDCGIY